tara:strand:- start:116 stop:1261 length:1146 start_codon:yes stop_codon:yes gene_type:complete
MKKILIFSLAYHPFVGGAEIAIKEITDHLPNNDYYLITNKFNKNWKDEEKIRNVKVIRLGDGKKIDKYLYPFRAVIHAINLNKLVKFDFVWSIMAFYAGLAALFFKYKTKVPYLLTLQSGDSDKFLKKRTWFWSYYYKRIYRKAKITQVISKFLAIRSRKMGNKGKIVLVPNGVNIDTFKPSLSEKDKDNLKKKLGITKDEIVLITTSRLVLKNGIDDLIKSFNFLLYKKGLRVKLLIIGIGPKENELYNLAKKLGVYEAILFLGYIEYKDLAKYVEMSDIFIRPSLSEGFGNSFVEAMAVNTPIIGTKVGGIIDFLKEGETGLFCKVRDNISIAQAVEKYIKDKSLYKNIQKKGRKLVLEKYSWNIVAKNMDKVFNDMKE